MKNWLVTTDFVFVFFYVVSCNTSQLSTNVTKQPLLIQTLSLYNQQLTASSDQPKTWIGDWFFRHKRLALIQQPLSEDQADLIFLQEAMEKKDNDYKSDRHILKAGALSSYDFQKMITNTFHSTDEIEYALLAYKKSATFFPQPKAPQLHKLGTDGYVTTSSAMLNNERLLVVHVHMPKNGTSQQWFHELKKKIKQRLLSTDTCQNRLIIGGYFTNEPNNPYYLKLLQDLRLKDTAQGFCELETSCYTLDPRQDLAQLALQDQSLNRSDRILVPIDAAVLNSQLNFNTSVPAPPTFQATYGLKKLFPSIRFGWQSNVIMPACANHPTNSQR